MSVEVLLISASIVVFGLQRISRDIHLLYKSSLTRVTPGNSSFFNRGSCYKYNYARINYNKPSTGTNGNVWNFPYNKIVHVIMSDLLWSSH